MVGFFNKKGNIMEIHKLLTPYNHSAGDVSRIKYIVIHYVGALGGAKANCQYYASGNIGASAHYYIDFDGSVWQSVEDKDIAWHCGTKSGYKHANCRNSNSLGIELCVRNQGNQASDSHDWYFEQSTVDAAIVLTQELMKKYAVPPDQVLRHYDVTGKICPNPYVYNHTIHTWDAFKLAIKTSKLSQHREGFIAASDGKRWWYQYKDGTYAKNGWYWLTEATSGTSGWYLFNEDGYMLTGYQKDQAGEVFFLCPDVGVNEGKCMITNGRGVLTVSEKYDFNNHIYLTQ